MCCDLLETYLQPAPWGYRIWLPDEFNSNFPTLARYRPADRPSSATDLPRIVAEQLRREVELDIEQLREDLIEHLELRIGEIDETLSDAFDSLLYREDWVRADVLRLAQLNDLPARQFPMRLEKMRSRSYRYRLSDLDRWRTEAAGLSVLHDRRSLFAEFSRIESDLEPCYKMVYEAAVQTRIRE
jgi:hypothetical protein